MEHNKKLWPKSFEKDTRSRANAHWATGLRCFACYYVTKIYEDYP